ncbi:2-aminoethylphosphonate--pyruvate transaminase [Limimonas halophila]|uniref:2-aminoethylphosphonate--pyruvate transaminase n=1 Tax=Limimonas halophila TaxID=1082479 RepID=A0A1G7MBN8_9PROT|nr:2-aminoethylphosphonate--pyruvate transaminase [Limimonas halophila]SDF58580.1 2-aminoethylphosphonate--pyruvate transaminase [Limimonas halophila]
MADDDAPILLTPGPLTTSAGVKAAMDRDHGSRDPGFLALTQRVRERLLRVVGGDPATHAAVPLAGSGTTAVEAMVLSLVPPDGRLLMLVNGAYGERMAQIARAAGRDVTTLTWPEDSPVDPGAVDAALAADPAIGHVAVVHVETTTGLENPLHAIARTVQARGRALLVDAVASVAATPLDLQETPVHALAGTANKGLQGVPGLAFCVARRDALDAADGRAPSLTLDLAAQWRRFQRDGQWRFTPPTHAVAALDRALDELDGEGGVPARIARYRDNCATLRAGLRARGFVPLLPDAHQAPTIVTVHRPPELAFDALYDGLAARGFLIYPRKLTAAETFRVGCIGAIGRREIEGFLIALDDVTASLRP